ncbi:MAG: hypothetical protein AB7U43_05580 [Desulfobacter sp.]
MGFKSTEAGPDSPIYKRSWTFGGMRLTPSLQSDQEPQTDVTPSPVPQSWEDQVAIEAWEALHGEVMSPEKMAELGLSTAPSKKD